MYAEPTSRSAVRFNPEGGFYDIELIGGSEVDLEAERTMVQALTFVSGELDGWVYEDQVQGECVA